MSAAAEAICPIVRHKNTEGWGLRTLGSLELHSPGQRQERTFNTLQYPHQVSNSGQGSSGCTSTFEEDPLAFQADETFRRPLLNAWASAHGRGGPHEAAGWAGSYYKAETLL